MQIQGRDNPFGNLPFVSPSCLGAVIRALGGPALPPPGFVFGRAQEPAPSPPAAFCLSISVGEGAGDHQVLQVPGKARWLGMGAELCDHRPQQPLVQATLYRQRQLCPHVSASLGPSPTLGNPGLREGAGGGHCWLGEAGAPWDIASAPRPVHSVLGDCSLSTFIFMKRLPSLHSRKRFRSFSTHSLHLLSALSFNLLSELCIK